MGPGRVLLIGADAGLGRWLLADPVAGSAVSDCDRPLCLADRLPLVAAGTYAAALCVVERPEDLAAVVRIRKVRPELPVVALTDGAPRTLRNLARQMGASSVVDRAADPPRTGLQLAAALRSGGQGAKSADSVRRTASEIRARDEGCRELVARAAAVLAICNDRPFVVLHVDDDPYEEFALRRHLLLAGLPTFVRSFRSPDLAIRYLTGEGEYADRALHPLPALVVSDLRMGVGMDGVDFLAWIRRHPDHRSLGFVLVTTSEAEQDVLRAAESGANLYLVKSVRMEGVVDVLRSAYENWIRLGSGNRASPP